jgi:Flp pilus assembly pilin Flp
MTFFANIKNFAADESGAVTVDWVVLTAAIVGLGIAVVASVRGGVENVAEQIENSMKDVTITPLVID